MSILWLLVPLSLVLVLLWGGIYVWSVQRGQLEDLDGAAVRILFDDEDLTPKASKAKTIDSQQELDKETSEN